MLIGIAGTDDTETISCPAGYSLNAGKDANGNDQTWCEDANGNRVPVVSSVTASVTSGLGVLGWGAVVAGSMIVLALVMSKHK